MKTLETLHCRECIVALVLVVRNAGSERTVGEVQSL